MSTPRRDEPPLVRQAVEGIGIVALGTAAIYVIGWVLALIVTWIL